MRENINHLIWQTFKEHINLQKGLQTNFDN